MSHRYHNARKVLPREVFDVLSKALEGKDTYLWVPGSRKLSREGRYAYVAALHREGLTALDIAGQLFLSERTVWRILAKAKAPSLPSAPAPDGPQRNPDVETER